MSIRFSPGLAGSWPELGGALAGNADGRGRRWTEGTCSFASTRRSGWTGRGRRFHRRRATISRRSKVLRDGGGGELDGRRSNGFVSSRRPSTGVARRGRDAAHQVLAWLRRSRGRNVVAAAELWRWWWRPGGMEMRGGRGKWRGEAGFKNGGLGQVGLRP